MNLLPPGFRYDRQARGSGPSRRRSFVVGALSVGLSLALILVEVRALTARLQKVRTERDRLAMQVAQRKDAEERLRSDRERLNRLRAVEGRLARWHEERSLLPGLLRGLSRAVPDAVVLETLRREGGDLRITGRGPSSAAVAEAVAALSRLERIGNLELLWVEQVDSRSLAGEQRFAVGGDLRYSSREPEPFQEVGFPAFDPVP